MSSIRKAPALPQLRWTNDEAMQGKTRLDAGLKFISNGKTKIDACVDYTRPALTIDIESISKYLADIKAKSGLRELAKLLHKIYPTVNN